MGTIRIPTAIPLPHLILLLLLTLHLVAAASPKVSRQEFDEPLSEAQFFDDSDVVLITDVHQSGANRLYISTDAGESWDPVKDINEHGVAVVMMSPHDNKVAIALSVTSRAWITKNRGEDWHEFKLPDDALPAFRAAPLVSFHADDSDKIILNTRVNRGTRAQAVYTKNSFKDVKILRDDSLRCLWAREQPQFRADDDDKEDKYEDRALCITTGKYNPENHDAQRLMISDNYFKDETEAGLEDGRPVPGIVSVVAARGFVLAARQTSGTTEMALYVTTDTKEWHRAIFGEHLLRENGYTIMDSTNYSLQVDVRTGSAKTPPMGALFTSNSHGYNFVQNEEATNRNELGFVDFEKVTNIQGIVLVNVVDNVEDVRDGGADKRKKSQISFDDGRTFEDLKAGDDRPLQLHSVTDASNVGSVFSSPAPGMLMGVGNTGRTLDLYEKGDLWVSDDAGRHWRHALGGPHKYEFGDQGALLVAVYDGGDINKISYSTNHGKNWQPVQFDQQDLKDDFRAKSLTTHPDSTSLKFILKATVGSGSSQKYYLYSINFEKVDLRACKDDDFERFDAVVDDDGKPRCVMGHKQSFRRRKADADCFVDEKFKDPEPEYSSKGCTCTVKDYECDAGFRRSKDRKSCDPIEPMRPSSKQCKDDDDKTFKASNGFRRIPGNQCEEDKDDPIDGKKEYDCEASSKRPNDGEIQRSFQDFKATNFREYYYLERPATSSDTDETVVVTTDKPNQFWVSHDHGKSWDRPDEVRDDEIVAIYPHRYFQDRVYLLTRSRKVYFSASRGKKFSTFEAPGKLNTRNLQILGFHPKQDEWLIWTSCSDEDRYDCIPESHVSLKNGRDWKFMLGVVGECEFLWRDDRDVDEKLIYCARHQKEDLDAPQELLSSDDFFDQNKEQKFDNVVNFATMSEYIVVAAKDTTNDRYLKIDSSVDAKTFADARFPSNLRNTTSTAYTVLDSSTHSIFLHVTVNSLDGQEYGTIIKSNSNGTSYSLSLRNVNRNKQGFVDFEKITSMEGVAITNIISNTDAVNDGASKKLQTLITHNDGARWDFIKPPAKDADDKDYKCMKDGEKDPEKCSLHLHGYTERKDARDTFGSPSAIGFIMGVGNVGSELMPKHDSDTFISSDGGITWRTAINGQYMWEYGDQGSIVVIVEEDAETDIAYYSRDEGRTWREYRFSDNKILINDITTVPSDTSMNFLLWGISPRSKTAVAINIDFSGLAPEKCNLETPDTPESDYTTFVPKHPFQDNGCLFGHQYEYYRKKPEATCYNGPILEDNALFNQKVKNCTCTAEDFECDYNYERNEDGDCKLVPGQKPLSKEEWCAQNPKADTWYQSPYRRIPLTTCEGGKEKDYSATNEPCPGHEEAHYAKHGISGVGLFFAIVLPIAAACAIGWWIYTRYEGQVGMGRIRLGEAGPSGVRLRTGGGDWSKYPVMIISGAAAVVMVVPMVGMSLFQRVRAWTPWRSRGYAYQPYRSRGSFSRGGRDYVSVGGQDESDLLGEDSDDDV